PGRGLVVMRREPVPVPLVDLVAPLGKDLLRRIGRQIGFLDPGDADLADRKDCHDCFLPAKIYRQPPPPFTITVSPVMKLQASEHMNSTSSPISSGSPKRFIGTSSRKRRRISGEVCAASWNGVRIGPGEIERQRIPEAANSRATPSVIDTTAPLAAA